MEKKQTRVYLVYASHGSYEDYQELALSAYLNEESANAEREALCALDRMLWDKANGWREKNPEPDSGMQNPDHSWKETPDARLGEIWDKWDARRTRFMERLDKRRRCHLGEIAYGWHDAPDYSVRSVELKDAPKQEPAHDRD